MTCDLSPLIPTIEARTGKTVTLAWLETVTAEVIAYTTGGPAACKRAVWLTWCDLPVAVQAVLTGVLCRISVRGDGYVSAETISEYSVRYAQSDFQYPRLLLPQEEAVIAAHSGCGQGLYSITVGTIRPTSLDAPEDAVLSTVAAGHEEEPSHQNGWRRLHRNGGA
jgi:hypothetical protein